MAADLRNSTSEMIISRRPKKNRNRVNANANATVVPGNREFIVGSSSPILIKPKTEPAKVVMTPAGKVSVLYYLTRNGHIEHPHLIDVPLSSPNGLYLRDVMNTLNYHRGKGMANMYSWSFKRSYKNGYVWHDLTEDDLVEATSDHDYILKGSEILQTDNTGDNCSSTTTAAAAAMIRRRNQSWSSFDNPQEYMVLKCQSNRELAAKFAAAADASTQTEEQRRRPSFEQERLRREEMPSPPPSNSSSEVSEEVSARRYFDPTVSVRDRNPTVEEEHECSGKMKGFEILMQLITCGAPSRLKMQAG